MCVLCYMGDWRCISTHQTVAPPPPLTRLGKIFRQPFNRGWVGVDILEKRKISSFCWELNCDSFIVQSVACSYFLCYPGFILSRIGECGEESYIQWHIIVLINMQTLYCVICALFFMLHPDCHVSNCNAKVCNRYDGCIRWWTVLMETEGILLSVRASSRLWIMNPQYLSDVTALLTSFLRSEV